MKNTYLEFSGFHDIERLVADSEKRKTLATDSEKRKTLVADSEKRKTK